MDYETAYRWLHGDRTEYSGCRAAAEAMGAEVKRLRMALQYAQGGLKMAYEAAEKKFSDEVMLHCGHHEAAIAKALKPNASPQPAAGNEATGDEEYERNHEH